MRFRFQLYSSVITIVSMVNERGDLCEIIELTRADGSRKGWEVKINGRMPSKKAPILWNHYKYRMQPIFTMPDLPPKHDTTRSYCQ